MLSPSAAPSCAVAPAPQSSEHPHPCAGKQSQPPIPAQSSEHARPAPAEERSGQERSLVQDEQSRRSRHPAGRRREPRLHPATRIHPRFRSIAPPALDSRALSWTTASETTSPRIPRPPRLSRPRVCPADASAPRPPSIASVASIPPILRIVSRAGASIAAVAIAHPRIRLRRAPARPRLPPQSSASPSSESIAIEREHRHRATRQQAGSVSRCCRMSSAPAREQSPDLRSAAPVPAALARSAPRLPAPVSVAAPCACAA